MNDPTGLDHPLFQNARFVWNAWRLIVVGLTFFPALIGITANLGEIHGRTPATALTDAVPLSRLAMETYHPVDIYPALLLGMTAAVFLAYFLLVNPFFRPSKTAGMQRHWRVGLAVAATIGAGCLLKANYFSLVGGVLFGLAYLPLLFLPEIERWLTEGRNAHDLSESADFSDAVRTALAITRFFPRLYTPYISQDRVTPIREGTHAPVRDDLAASGPPAKPDSRLYGVAGGVAATSILAVCGSWWWVTRDNWQDAPRVSASSQGRVKTRVFARMDRRENWERTHEWFHADKIALELPFGWLPDETATALVEPTDADEDCLVRVLEVQGGSVPADVSALRHLGVTPARVRRLRREVRGKESVELRVHRVRDGISASPYVLTCTLGDRYVVYLGATKTLSNAVAERILHSVRRALPEEIASATALDTRPNWQRPSGITPRISRVNFKKLYKIEREEPRDGADEQYQAGKMYVTVPAGWRRDTIGKALRSSTDTTNRSQDGVAIAFVGSGRAPAAEAMLAAINYRPDRWRPLAESGELHIAEYLATTEGRQYLFYCAHKRSKSGANSGYAALVKVRPAGLRGPQRREAERIGEGIARSFKAEGGTWYQSATGEMVRTDSGLGYKIVSPGIGVRAKWRQYALVHYDVYDDGGRLLDSTVGLDSPLEFRLGDGNVFRGMEEGVFFMRVGSHHQFTVPAGLASGRIAGTEIPLNTPLTVECWLLGVGDAPGLNP